MPMYTAIKEQVTMRFLKEISRSNVSQVESYRCWSAVLLLCDGCVAVVSCRGVVSQQQSLRSERTGTGSAANLHPVTNHLVF